jgi:hypothetical protein
MLIHNANVTGSMHLNGMDMSTLTGSVSTTTFNQYTSSTNEFTGSANSSITNLNNASGSFSTRVTSLESFSASLDATFATDAQLSSLSGSVAERLTTDESTITNNSSSFASRLTTDEGNISSLQTASGSISTRVTTIESKYATTGSNTFTGTQNVTNTTNATGFTSEAALRTDGGLRVTKDAYVSGSMYVNNLTVYGSASVEYVTSSVLIGLSSIDLNTDTPSLRYAGINVYDSGSTGVSASLLYDSENNQWVFAHENSGSETVDSSILLFGPLSTSGLGTEPALTSNAVLKVSNEGHGHHLTASSITDNGSTVSINSNTNVVGSLNATSLTGSLDGSNLINSSISNSKLANSSVTVTAGNGLSGGGSVTLGSSITLTNNGILDVDAGTGISVGYNALTQTATVNNTGILDVDAGVGISVGYNALTQTSTVNNTGILDVDAGVGISVGYNALTQTSTVNNTGILDVDAGTGISVGYNALTQTSTINNTGILNVSAGTGISVGYNALTQTSTVTNSGVISFNTRTGTVTLSSSDVTTALGYTPYNSTNPSGYITGINSSMVTTALGYTPVTNARTLTINGTAYDLSADRSWTIAAGVTSVSAGTGISVNQTTGAVTVTNSGVTSVTAGSGISVSAGTGGVTITNTITNNNQLTNGAGYITGINSSMVTSALGFTPYNATNPSGYITGITSTMVTNALGYTPYNSSNPSGYITGINSSMVTTALGYTPYNSSNPSGYITSSALSSYLPLSGGTLTGALTIGTSVNSVIWNDGTGTYIENTGTSSATRVIRLQAHNGSFSYTQLFINGGGGFVSVNNQMRAPIFYDLDDTTYYLDPNSSPSLFSNGTVVAGNQGFQSRFYTSGRNRIWSFYNSDNYGLSYFQGGPDYIGLHFGTATQAASAFWVSDSGISQTSASSRAPIFYDSNNTGFYLDPNGGSNLNDVTAVQYYVSGWFRNNSSNTGLYNQVTTQHLSSNTNGYWDMSSTTSVSSIRFYTGGHVTSIRGYVYANTSNEVGFLTNDGNWGLQVDSSKNVKVFGTDLTVGNSTSSNIYMTDTDESTRRIHCNSGRIGFLNTSNNWGAYCDNSGNWFSDHSMRAPIFYDSNDTGYFTDPAGISSMWGVAIRGDNGSTNTNNQIFFWGAGNTTTSAIGFKANGGNFSNPTGNGDGYNTYLTMDTDGRGWVFRRGVGGTDFGSAYTSGWILNNGIWQANASMRSPIFYDSNNTGYYTDPASTSVMNVVQFGTSTNSGRFTGDSTWGVRFYTDSGYIWFGPANSGHAHIYTDRSNFYFNAQLTVNDGSQINTSDIRANIFYDKQDTGYYVDPNGTSNLNKLSEFTMAYNGMNPMSANSPYAARYAGSALYRNGTMGNGNTDFNVMFSNWGSGFIDSWSSPANAPGGSSHYVGLQGFHYNHVNNSQAYGFQMACAGEAVNRYFWRNAWPNLNGWVEMIHSGNIGSQSVNYATSAGTASSANSVAWGNVSSKPSNIMYYQSFTLDANTMDSNSTGFTYSVNAPYTGPIARFSTGGGYDLWLNAPYGGNGYGLAFRTRNGDAGSFNSWQYPAVYGVNANGGGALYATIYYDQDNTGYYLNPASTTNLNTLYVNDWYYLNGSTGMYWSSYSRGFRSPEGEGNSYGTVTTVGSGRNGWHGWGIGSRHVFMSTTGDNVGVHDNSRGWIWYWNGSFTSFDFGYTQFAGSARSPIFYDNNDTGYYVDPNSTSRMNRTNYDYVYSYNWIYAQGDVVAYYSDERLKTKTGNIENALDKIKQLNGFYYTNNDLAKSFGYKEEKTQVGLSAQEVQSVLPEVVTLAPFDTEFDENNQSVGSKSGENYLTVNYDKLVPLLIEAIKEQQSQIEELKSKLDGLTK